MKEISVNERRRPEATSSGWVPGIAGLLVPGLGHILNGRIAQGLIFGGMIIALVITGLLLGGHFFVLGGYAGSSLPWILESVFAVANLGNGLLYVICNFIGVGFANSPELAKNPNFDYGNTFLLISGLLNYLLMLDAFDIAVGRKP